MTIFDDHAKSQKAFFIGHRSNNIISMTYKKNLFEILHGHRKLSLEPLLCVIKQYCRYSTYSLGYQLSFERYYESIRCLVGFLSIEM